MGRGAKEKQDAKIKLKHPDRSGPDPSRQTLLDIAEQRGLLNAQLNGGSGDDEPLVGRLGDSILWSISLTMLHFTLDVLVSHQYAQEISWPTIIKRAIQALPAIFVLLYAFHQHPSPSPLLPTLSPRVRYLLHQVLFFSGSVSAGCYLIYITNEKGYYAQMKQAPPVGCLWIWSVIELDLLWATASLICAGGFWKYHDYAYL